MLEKISEGYGVKYEVRQGSKGWTDIFPAEALERQQAGEKGAGYEVSKVFVRGKSQRHLTQPISSARVIEPFKPGMMLPELKVGDRVLAPDTGYKQ